jgi:uncharacterized alkaline shock family protein YloU
MATPATPRSTSSSTAGAVPATTLAGSTGTTTIVDPVIAKVAGIAAREVAGVFALGGGAARAIGAIRDAMGSKDLSQGIKVEVGERQVAVDITIVAEYPLALQDVAEQVRQAVTDAIVDIIGMEVSEVNVTVTDVHIPGDDDVPADTTVVA